MSPTTHAPMQKNSDAKSWLTTSEFFLFVNTDLLLCLVQCGGSGSVDSGSFPWIPDLYKKMAESGSVSNDTDPDPTEAIKTENNFSFSP